jgi:hypothetical protein
MTSIDVLSLTTVPIHPFFNDVPLPHATAFVWKRNNRHYLVTNWHVVAARNTETGENLLCGARPNKLKAQFNLRVPVFEKDTVDIPIRDDEDSPLWHIHTTHAHKRIDIVAIPLELGVGPMQTALNPINELANARLRIEIGMEVFILGYPFGAKPPALPVWKRGSIASEPDLVRLTDGYYLIDTASRPGMSGSPVILRSWTNHMTEPGVMAISDKPLNRMIGVYSGRLHSHSAEAQVGMVWHESFIDEIIDGNTRDN